MLIAVKDIVTEDQVTLEQEVTMTEEQIRDGHFAGPLHCNAAITRINNQFYAKVSYKGAIAGTCSRCLDDITLPLKGSVEVTIKDEAQIKEPQQEVDSSEYYFVDATSIVDIRQSLYEDVMINMPIKPLCKEECPGIVEYKNEEPPEEDQKAVDPRWEALKKLKK